MLMLVLDGEVCRLAIGAGHVHLDIRMRVRPLELRDRAFQRQGPRVIEHGERMVDRKQGPLRTDQSDTTDRLLSTGAGPHPQRVLMRCLASDLPVPSSAWPQALACRRLPIFMSALPPRPPIMKQCAETGTIKDLHGTFETAALRTNAQIQIIDHSFTESSMTAPVGTIARNSWGPASHSSTRP